jgi:hypothetical protein
VGEIVLNAREGPVPSLGEDIGPVEKRDEGSEEKRLERHRNPLSPWNPLDRWIPWIHTLEIPEYIPPKIKIKSLIEWTFKVFHTHTYAWRGGKHAQMGSSGSQPITGIGHANVVFVSIFWHLSGKICFDKLIVG